MNIEQQQSAFESWFRQKYDSELYCQARKETWQAALESPEVQALYVALWNLYQAIDSSVDLTPEVMRQAKDALAAMEKQK